MKTFRLIGMAIAALMTWVSFASCSDDDDASSLVGKWEVVSITPEGEDDVLDIGTVIEFCDNGRVYISGRDKEGEEPYIDFYEISDTTLRINYNCGHGYVDDYVIGTYQCSGDIIEWTYIWHDGNESWVDTQTFTVSSKKSING